MRYIEKIKNEKNLIGELLTTMTPTIDKMTNESLRWMEKETKRPTTEFDREYVEMYIVSDLIKSIEKYTKPTDTLVELISRTSNKGNIEISSVINRDGVDYTLSTEVIYAGGYNIQVLHYRYITNSKLPKSFNSNVLNGLKVEKKRLNKVERINEEIKRYKGFIHQSTEQITNGETLDYDGKLKLKKREAYFLTFAPFDTISDYGKELYKNEAGWKKHEQDYYDEKVVEFDQHLDVERYRLKDLEKTLKKYEARLELLKS